LILIRRDHERLSVRPARAEHKQPRESNQRTVAHPEFGACVAGHVGSGANHAHPGLQVARDRVSRSAALWHLSVSLALYALTKFEHSAAGPARAGTVS
jgi:hypothetical protein